MALEWLAGIGSLADAFTSIFNNERNISNTKDSQALSQEYQTREREAAQQYQTQERLAVQEYNSPVNQMDRLRAAGINPNNAVGQITGNSGASPMSSSGMSSSAQTFGMSPNLGLADFARLVADIQKTRAETQAIETSNRYADERESVGIAQQKVALKLADKDIALKESQKGLNDFQLKQQKELLPLLVSQNEQQVEVLKKTLSKYDSEIALINQQKSVALKQEGLVGAQIGQVNKLKELTDSQIVEQAWVNSCRENGFDPKSDLGQNLLRILMAEPKKATSIINNAVDAVSNAFKTVKAKDKNHLIFGHDDYKTHPPYWDAKFTLIDALFNAFGRNPK